MSFTALNPIEPHAPPVAVLPRQFLLVSSLRTYSPSGRLNNFSPALGALVGPPTPSLQRLHPGLPGYLIPFAPQGFVPYRRTRSSQTPSPLVVLLGLQDFTPTPEVPLTSPGPKSSSLLRSRTVKLPDLPKGLPNRLRTL